MSDPVPVRTELPDGERTDWGRVRMWILARAASLDDCHRHPNTTRYDEDDLLEWFLRFGDAWTTKPCGRRGNEVEMA